MVAEEIVWWIIVEGIVMVVVELVRGIMVRIRVEAKIQVW